MQTLDHSIVDGHASAHDGHDTGSLKVLGLWVYLMSDCILFGSLFASYAVLSGAFAGGPGPKDIFDLPYVLVETFVLLFSSITYGYAMLAVHRRDRGAVLRWLSLTFILGAVFVGMEINEFHHLISLGYGPQRSGFLSGFFALVATHGLHVTAGLVWMAVVWHQVATKGLTPTNVTRLSCLSLFWHFLDLVWICVFTIVYHRSVLTMANHATTRAGEAHGSAKSYNTGFMLSIILTVIPFALVMHPVLPRATTLLVAVIFAVVQVVVHLVYFLHMNRSSEGGWNLISFVFTLVILFIVVALSVWIIWSMHYNMMIN